MKYVITKYTISSCTVEAGDKLEAKTIAAQRNEFEREEQADFLWAEAVENINEKEE